MSGLIIPVNQEIHFDAITSDSAGQTTDADVLPTWLVFEQTNDTPIASGVLTKRIGYTGDYRSSFFANAVDGFIVGNFYSVIGEAIVNGVAGKCVILIFRCGPAEETTGVPNVNIYNIDPLAAEALADNILDRNMAAGPDSGSADNRTVRQALRMLRNRWYISGGVLYVCKEDDLTESWIAQPNTDPSAEPIIGINPAGGS